MTTENNNDFDILLGISTPTPIENGEEEEIEYIGEFHERKQKNGGTSRYFAKTSKIPKPIKYKTVSIDDQPSDNIINTEPITGKKQIIDWYSNPFTTRKISRGMLTPTSSGTWVSTEINSSGTCINNEATKPYEMFKPENFSENIIETENFIKLENFIAVEKTPLKDTSTTMCKINGDFMYAGYNLKGLSCKLINEPISFNEKTYQYIQILFKNKTEQIMILSDLLAPADQS